MKQLLIIFSLLVSCMSCNTKHKETAKTEIIEIVEDTIVAIEKEPLQISKNLVLGQFDYRSDSTFVKVNQEYTTKEIFLNKTVADAFIEMRDAAKKDSIDLIIISGTRNFKEQKAIWERKWNTYNTLKPLQRAKKILEYSSMPSSSRHHWGTDIDINSLNNLYFNSGKGLAEYNWLKTHANSFGFYQVYTQKSKHRTGYNLEKWHWSYLPLASKYLEFYNKKIINSDINGFKGFEQAQKVKIIEDYVNGISKKARDYK